MAKHPGVTLVCGGGGVWGVAWMTGIVAGLADRGLDVRQADVFIGTSAGSVMSAQLSSTLSTAELFDRQTDPAKQPYEPAPEAANLAGLTDLMQQPWRNPRERLEAIRRLALEAKTMNASERQANIVHRLGLPSGDWPRKPVSITAVDVETLDLCVFDAGSGISLVDAVTASCAVPGVWPPAVIKDRRYLDGGVWHTSDNAHLAEGSSAILILSPMAQMFGAGLAADVSRLQQRGTMVAVIAPDEASLRAMSPHPLDPATRKPAAEAGRLQGAREISAALRVFDPARD